MDYTEKIERVKKRIEELNQTRQILYKIEESVLAAEREVDDINSVLPSDAHIRAMKDSQEKKQLQQLVDLANQAFEIIDEILGPPDEIQGQEPGQDEDSTPGVPWMAYSIKGPSTKS